ncbi:MAG: FtsX-like permease family protein, partial [Desulfobacterales bacterium]|nr:FtsX-like permease family protein [Desulfobacterales bacterium]
MPFELFIGSRYLRVKQKQSFISLITLLSIAGVTVGVMALIVVIAVMTGFESDMKSRILGVESHIVVMRHGGSFSGYRNTMNRIESADGVQATTPFIYSQVMIRSATGVSGAVLRGIDPETVGSVVKFFKDADLARLVGEAADGRDPSTAPGIIVGKELAKNLGVSSGDTIAMISPRGMLSPIGHMPAMKQFKIKGLFESGMYEFDNTLVYIHLKTAQKMMRMADTVTGIEVRVGDIYRADQIGKTLARDLGFPYWVRDWMRMNRNLFSALKLEKTAMFIILALIVLVAAFNIASSLIMMVMEKTKDIAILKAMGATDKSIRRIFIYKGMAIGVVGTILGVCGGIILCMLLSHYKFIELPGDVYY